MLEYVFFHPDPYQRFIQFVQERGLTPEFDGAGDAFDLDTLEVRLPDDLDDDLSGEIEAFYDQMMELSRELVDTPGAADPGSYQAAGVVLNLQDGRTVYAQVDPGLLGRVMGVLTPEEFGRIVNAIVDAVEHPDERSVCGRIRDGG